MAGLVSWRAVPAAQGLDHLLILEEPVDDGLGLSILHALKLEEGLRRRCKVQLLLLISGGTTTLCWWSVDLLGQGTPICRDRLACHLLLHRALWQQIFLRIPASEFGRLLELCQFVACVGRLCLILLRFFRRCGPRPHIVILFITNPRRGP